MKTIVKGKIQEVKYNFDYPMLYFGMRDYMWITYLNYNNEQQLERNKAEKDKILNYIESDYISKSYSIIDYETFYTSDKLTFTLNVGDLIFIEDNSYKIEKVEGIDDNTVIYYVDNILRIEEDLISYEVASKELIEYKNKKLEVINKDIEYYQKQIEADSNVKNIEKEIDRIPNKKWYQFWK